MQVMTAWQKNGSISSIVYVLCYHTFLLTLGHNQSYVLTSIQTGHEVYVALALHYCKCYRLLKIITRSKYITLCELRSDFTQQRLHLLQ